MLRRGFRLNNQQSQQLRYILQEVYKFRDWAVHPPSDFRQPVLHKDLDSGVEWRFVAYSAHNSEVIFNAIVRLMSVLFGHARLELKDLSKWVDAASKRLTEGFDTEIIYRSTDR